MPLDRETAFISYSRKDSEFALRLARDLKAAGAQVWLDQLDIQPGQRWPRAIEEAMKTAPRMLVVLSPASVLSSNVEDEIAFALEEHKVVIPILYRDCQIPFRLRNCQYADFRGDFAAGLASLLRVVGVISSDAGGETPAEFLPSAPPDVPIDPKPGERQVANEVVVAAAAQGNEPPKPQTNTHAQVRRSLAYRFGLLTTRPWFISGILIVLWLLLFVLHIAGAFIHLLLVIAFVLPMFKRRRGAIAIGSIVVLVLVMYLLGAF